MLKLKLIAAVLFIALAAPIADAHVAEERPSLEMTGFEILRDNGEILELFHSNERTIIISKDSFKRENEARAFCKQHNAKLDKDFNVLLLAMSGASNANQFIENSISFKDTDRSGIQSWSGEGKEEIIRMYNGEGTRLDTISLSKLNNGQEESLSLPALCLKL